MNISDIIHRNPNPLPWAEEEKIPWNEPEFSRRMLREHLSQEHDMASRRAALIDQHVAWIEAQVLPGRRAKILDLGCGPGLYANRLAAHGHTVTGIDFSPASIEYARAHGQPGARYIEGDVRAVDFGTGYDLAMMLFGELNVFRPAEARSILAKAQAALVEGGLVVLEVHTLDCVRRLGQAPASWYSAAQGVFAAGPYLCLMENFWHAEPKVAMERFYVLEAGSEAVRRYGQSMQGYGEEEYTALLEEAGFRRIEIFAALTGKDEPGDLQVIVSRKESDHSSR